MKFALFLGRYQPPHLGHDYLVEGALREGLGALILVRDCEPDGANPLTAIQVKEILDKRWEGQNVIVQVVPDVISIRCGRKVGYNMMQVAMPDIVENVCATSIRRSIKEGRDDWKPNVHPSVHEMVEAALKEA